MQTTIKPVHEMPVMDFTPDSHITVPELNALVGHSHLIQDASNGAIHKTVIPPCYEGYDCE